MSGALQMPSQPQATLQATSVPMKLFQPERNYTQNVRKTHLLICDGIACIKVGSLTSLRSISAHICVSSIIALHQVRHCFRKHQLFALLFAHLCSPLSACRCSAFLKYSFLQSISERSSPTCLLLWVILLSPHFTNLC